MECVQTAMDEIPVKIWEEKRIYCVGKATRVAAERVLSSTELVCSENGNALHLSTLILKGFSFRFYFC